jgi:hypothetical protein
MGIPPRPDPDQPPGEPDAPYDPQVTVHTFDTPAATMAWLCTCFPGLSPYEMAIHVRAWLDQEQRVEPAQGTPRSAALGAAPDQPPSFPRRGRGSRPSSLQDMLARTRARAAYLAARHRRRGGRPHDTGDYRAGDGPKFLADLHPVAVQLVQSGEPLTVTSIAGSWSKSRPWVRKYRDLFSVNLATLEAEIREELGL